MSTATVTIKTLTMDEVLARVNAGELDGPANDERLVHLVLQSSWPIALCGANVTDRFGVKAPAMDRCHACFKLAAARGLGRPGWV